MQTKRDLLDVQHDVGDVLAHARNGREFVQHALDLDRGHRRALQRGQQHAAKRVAQGQPEAALQRFGDDGGRTRLFMTRIDFELLRFDQFLPIFLEHCLSSSFPGQTQKALPYTFDGKTRVYAKVNLA